MLQLQPIQTRLVMLQTGMRAPIGIKVSGPDLETLEKTALRLEHHLKLAEGVDPASVFADRVVGKPYLEIRIDRKAIARHGITVKDLQSYIGSAVGGLTLTTTVEGRERFPVRIRYAREYRDNPGDLKKVLIPSASGNQIPLGELTEIGYARGPQMIKSENTFLTAYIIFDKKEGTAEVDVVENAQQHLDDKIDRGELIIPAGVNYVFAGNYENQIRAANRLMVVIPASSMIFSGILVAFSGGFLMIWLYGQ